MLQLLFSRFRSPKSIIFLYLIARLRLEDQHCLPAITDDTALEYLVPTTSGAGALTTSLVDYLILAHNDFIETCSGRLKDKSQTYVSNLLL